MNAILTKTRSSLAGPWPRAVPGPPTIPRPSVLAVPRAFNFRLALLFTVSLFIAAGLTAYLLRVTPVVQSPEPPQGDAGREIAYLIGQVRRSPASFFQQGASVPARALASALEAKAEESRDASATTEEFLRLAFGDRDSALAACEVRHMDGTREPCAVWLKRTLRAYRLKTPAERPADLPPAAGGTRVP